MTLMIGLVYVMATSRLWSVPPAQRISSLCGSVNAWNASTKAGIRRTSFHTGTRNDTVWCSAIAGNGGVLVGAGTIGLI